MRVAVLAHSFPRFPGDTHGIFVKHLSEALLRREPLFRGEVRPAPDHVQPESPLGIQIAGTSVFPF